MAPSDVPAATQPHGSPGTEGPEGPATGARAAGRGRKAWWLLALAPAAAFVAFDSALAAFAGQVQDFGSTGAYRIALNLIALGRFSAMFAGALFVWGALRGRSAPRWVLTVAVLSGPLAYAVSWFFRSQAFFPPEQALYYAVNPLFVGAVFSQVGSASVAELAWRGWHKRHGSLQGPTPRWIWAVAIAGYLGMFLILLWDGGIHYFYWYQQLYKALFM